MYSQIPGSQLNSTIGPGFYTFPCDANVPIIYFTFGDYATGRQIVIISADSFVFGPLSQASDTCVGSMIAGQDNTAWYFGDSFMRNIYTIFDYDNNQVGFATLSSSDGGNSGSDLD